MSGHRESKPQFVKPGENPALDDALARVHRWHDGPEEQRAGAPGVGAERKVDAQLDAPRAKGPHSAAPAVTTEAPRRAVGEAARRRWWVVGLAGLSIVGAVAVMALAVLGRERRSGEEVAIGGATARLSAGEVAAPVTAAAAREDAGGVASDGGVASPDAGAPEAATPEAMSSAAAIATASARAPARPSAAPAAPKGTAPRPAAPRPAWTSTPTDPALNE